MISFNGFFFVFPSFFFSFNFRPFFPIFYLLFFFFKTYIWIRFYPPILLFIKHAILTHQSISHFFLTFFQFLFPIERPHRQYALNSPKPDPFSFTHPCSIGFSRPIRLRPSPLPYICPLPPFSITYCKQHTSFATKTFHTPVSLSLFSFSFSFSYY